MVRKISVIKNVLTCRGLKFVKRKWRIKKNNKEEVQFQTLCKAPTVGVKKKERAFCKKLKKAFNDLQ